MTKTVGVIGGGQLAWMMAPAARALGIKLMVQTPSLDDPAAKVADDVILGNIDDAIATAKLASISDVITFENEFINIQALTPLLEKGVCFHPSLTALSPLLDKYQQRCFFRDLGLPVPDFTDWDSNISIHSPFGFPVVVKARRHGYDGQGTFIIRSQEALEATWKSLEYSSLLLEEYVPFTKELGVMAARSVTGEIVIYPIVETEQENQVCRRVFAPAAISPEVSLQIEGIAHTILENLQFVGILGIELFITAYGKILVNEIAPRTHNSGHYTIDACEVSQFAMHLRTVAGLTISSPSLKSSAAVMVNLLGYEYSHHDYLEKRNLLAEIPHSYVHWYGKNESRPGRKLGHVTVLLDEEKEMKAIATAIESIWYK